MIERPPIAPLLLCVFILAVAVAVALIVADSRGGRPIPGGVVVYRGADRFSRGLVNCMCGHTGYYILTEGVVFGYNSGHDVLEPEGLVTNKSSGRIEYRRFERYPSPGRWVDDASIEVDGSILHVDIPGFSFRLKKDYLGPDIKKRVDEFDLESWKFSKSAK